MTQEYFEHNKGRIYYEITGTGETIVFIHGFSLDRRMWEEQAKFFENHFQVITYDMRGFGKSSLPEGKYSHHDDLRALLDHLKIKKAHIVGLSMGGEIAINFALTYPEFVSSLTLVDSSLNGFKSTVDWTVHAKEVGIDRARKNWLNHELFSSERKNSKVFSKIQQIVQEYSGWHWLNHEPKERIKPPALQRLNEIKVPTLVAVGQDDLPYFHHIAELMHDGISGSQMKIITGAGHMVNMEEPNYFNKLLLDFYSNLNGLHS